MDKSRKFRLGIIFVFPFVFTLLLYCLFSVTDCIESIELNIQKNARSLIENILIKQEKRLDLFANIIDIDPKKFKYSVNFQNNKKLAVFSQTAVPPYTEKEVLLTLITTTDEKIPIPYGQNKNILTNIAREEILENIKGYKFSFVGGSDQIFGPNSGVEIQDSSSLGAICYSVNLSLGSFLATFLITAIAFSGLIVIVRQMFQFVYLGKDWWLK